MIAMFLLCVVLPALAACIVLVGAWRPWRRPSRGSTGAWGLGVALCVCTLLSFGALESWAPWAAPARWYGLLPLSLTTAMLGVLAHWLPTRRPTIVGAGVLLGASGALWIDLPGVGGAVERVGLAIVIFMLTVAMAPATRPPRATPQALALAVVFATLSGLLWTTHFAKLSLITGSLSASFGLAAGVAAACSRGALGISATLTCGALLPALALTGYAYDYDTIPVACWVLVVAAPACVWVGEHPLVKRLTDWRRGAIILAAVAVPCLIALVMALAPGPGDEEDDYPAYGEYGQVDSSRGV